jgi:hypothetical protein
MPHDVKINKTAFAAAMISNASQPAIFSTENDRKNIHYRFVASARNSLKDSHALRSGLCNKGSLPVIVFCIFGKSHMTVDIASFVYPFGAQTWAQHDNPVTLARVPLR